jgi:alpha-1,2-mannosyltransferase
MLAAKDPILDVDRLRFDRMMPTVSANLQLLGVPATAIHLAQLGFALAAAAVIWRLWRRGPSRIGIAAVAASALLATPYGFVYDLVLTTGAVLLLIEEAMATRIALTTPELVVLLLALVLPITMFLVASAFPTSMLVLVALVAVIMRRAALSAPRRQPGTQY